MKKKLFKIALAVVGVLLGACIALFLIGGRTVVYRAEIEIAAPTATVFNHLTDTELLLQWMEGVTKIEPLTEGGHRVGGKARVTIHENENEFVMEDEVLKSEPGELLQVRLTCPVFAATSTYDMHSHGSVTHVSHELRSDYRGLFRLVAPFTVGSGERHMAGDLARLKQLIEQTEGGESPE